MGFPNKVIFNGVFHASVKTNSSAMFAQLNHFYLQDQTYFIYCVIALLFSSPILLTGAKNIDSFG